MIELTADVFSCVEPLLADFQQCIPLNGVLDGKHAGRVFVDDTIAPAAAYVWTPWGYHYLVGAPRDTAFIPALREKLAAELQPLAAAMGEPDILLTLHPGIWEAHLNQILPEPVIKIYRRHFAFNLQAFQAVVQRASIPTGSTLQQINVDLAYRLQDEICATWRSVEDFCANGFGYCLLQGDTIVSMCMAAFIARSVVEIGVRTDENFRRCGFGSLTATACIKHCLENGLRPNWECFWDNDPSVALARKLGFEVENDSPIYYWEGPHAP